MSESVRSAEGGEPSSSKIRYTIRTLLTIGSRIPVSEETCPDYLKCYLELHTLGSTAASLSSSWRGSSGTSGGHNASQKDSAFASGKGGQIRRGQGTDEGNSGNRSMNASNGAGTGIQKVRDFRRRGGSEDLGASDGAAEGGAAVVKLESLRKVALPFGGAPEGKKASEGAVKDKRQPGNRKDSQQPRGGASSGGGFNDSSSSAKAPSSQPQRQLSAAEKMRLFEQERQEILSKRQQSAGRTAAADDEGWEALRNNEEEQGPHAMEEGSFHAESTALMEAMMAESNQQPRKGARPQQQREEGPSPSPKAAASASSVSPASASAFAGGAMDAIWGVGGGDKELNVFFSNPDFFAASGGGFDDLAASSSLLLEHGPLGTADGGSSRLSSILGSGSSAGPKKSSRLSWLSNLSEDTAPAARQPAGSVLAAFDDATDDKLNTGAWASLESMIGSLDDDATPTRIEIAKPPAAEAVVAAVAPASKTSTTPMEPQVAPIISASVASPSPTASTGPAPGGMSRISVEKLFSMSQQQPGPTQDRAASAAGKVSTTADVLSKLGFSDAASPPRASASGSPSSQTPPQAPQAPGTPGNFQFPALSSAPMGSPPPTSSASAAASPNSPSPTDIPGSPAPAAATGKALKSPPPKAGGVSMSASTRLLLMQKQKKQQQGAPAPTPITTPSAPATHPPAIAAPSLPLPSGVTTSPPSTSTSPVSDLRGMQKIPLSALFAAKNSASASKS